MNNPTAMSKTTIKTLLLMTMLGTVSVSSANGFGNFFGGNNNSGFGNFFGGGNNNNCNNWPIWTPMYWMEEMTGSSFGNGFGNNSGFGGFGNNNRNCNNNGYGNYNRNYGGYGNSAYQNPYQSPYGASPYMNRNPYAGGQSQAIDIDHLHIIHSHNKVSLLLVEVVWAVFLLLAIALVAILFHRSVVADHPLVVLVHRWAECLPWGWEECRQ